MILDFAKPKKILPTEEHNRMYSSDSEAPGTYVPNMSAKDRKKWKAKKISGKDPRIEIRKSVEGSDGSSSEAYHSSAQVLIIVRQDCVVMSANGRMVWDNDNWNELNLAVKEARSCLMTKEKSEK